MQQQAQRKAEGAQRQLAGSPDGGKGGKKKPLFKGMCIAGKESL